MPSGGPGGADVELEASVVVGVDRWLWTGGLGLRGGHDVDRPSLSGGRAMRWLCGSYDRVCAERGPPAHMGSALPARLRVARLGSGRPARLGPPARPPVALLCRARLAPGSALVPLLGAGPPCVPRHHHRRRSPPLRRMDQSRRVTIALLLPRSIQVFRGCGRTPARPGSGRAVPRPRASDHTQRATRTTRRKRSSRRFSRHSTLLGLRGVETLGHRVLAPAVELTDDARPPEVRGPGEPVVVHDLDLEVGSWQVEPEHHGSGQALAGRHRPSVGQLRDEQR